MGHSGSDDGGATLGVRRDGVPGTADADSEPAETGELGGACLTCSLSGTVRDTSRSSSEPSVRLDSIEWDGAEVPSEVGFCRGDSAFASGLTINASAGPQRMIPSSVHIRLFVQNARLA